MFGLVAMFVSVICIVSACAGVPEAGSPVASAEAPDTAIPKGTIAFGTGGTGCALTGQATTFPTSATFRLVTYFARPLRAGEPYTMRVTGPVGPEETDEGPPPTRSDCLSNEVYAGLAPGHYVLEFRAGNEVLSQGAFDITP
jgi:hypothetical protein